MDFQLYEGLKNFITNDWKVLPGHLDSKLRMQIRNKHHLFNVKNDGKLYFGPREDRMVIREDEFDKTMKEAHDNGGHFGIEKVYDKLKIDHYWPEMIHHIDKYIRGCDVCQKRKGKEKPHEPLHPIKANRPFELIGIDCVGPLPETDNKNKYIIVMTDYFTKWPEAAAVQDIKATTIAKFLYDFVFSRYGTPEKIITDQGTSFDNQLVDALLQIMGTQHTMTTAYHPQTNGQTEKFNGTLCNTIAKHMIKEGGSWDQWINTVLWEYRTQPHSSTKHRPDIMLYGWPMQNPYTIERRQKKGEEPIELTYEQHRELISDKLYRVHNEAKQNVEKAQERQKTQYDKKVKPIKYKIGQKVLLFNERKENKFDQKWLGPYYIQAAFDNGTYALSDMESGEIIEISVNSKRLKEYHDKPAYIPKTIIIEDTQRLKELEERTKQVQRRSNRMGEVVREEAEAEYRQMKRLEKQIEDRERQRRLNETNRMREIARESQRKNDERISQRLRSQIPKRLVTRKDREALIVLQTDN